MINEKFIIPAALLHLTGQFTYAKNTILGQTKPNRVTFFMWALSAFVAFGAELNQKIGLTALMTFMVGFGPALIFTASFINKKAYWRLTKFDFLCGALSLLGLVLWLITDDPNKAIAFAIFGDVCAGIPTFRKVFKHPETETYYLFFTGSVLSATTILTINNWNFATYAFPIMIFAQNFYMFLFAKFRIGPRFAKAWV